MHKNNKHSMTQLYLACFYEKNTRGGWLQRKQNTVQNIQIKKKKKMT